MEKETTSFQSPLTQRGQKLARAIEFLIGLSVAVTVLLDIGSWGEAFEWVWPMALLVLFYLCSGPFLFGAVGWRRILGSIAAGFVLSAGVAGLLFRLASWANAIEIAQFGGLSAAVLAVVAAGFGFFRREAGGKFSAFFWEIFIRAVPLVLLNAWAATDFWRRFSSF